MLILVSILYRLYLIFSFPADLRSLFIVQRQLCKVEGINILYIMNLKKKMPKGFFFFCFLRIENVYFCGCIAHYPDDFEWLSHTFWMSVQINLNCY